MGAQNNIDNIVLDIFGKDKFFVEAGGSDPEDQNNTSLLESNGWKGLIVEPKTDFNLKYERMRKNSILENYVLVSNDHLDETVEGDFNHYMMGGVVNIHNLPWTPKPYPCIQLHKLIKKHNINEVHFFSLDVEGYEKEVLNGINFDEVFFHLIVVENHIKNGIKDNFDFLLNNGFEKQERPGYHEYYFNTKSKYKI
jgi:FkbM family methyltransferase